MTQRRKSPGATCKELSAIAKDMTLWWLSWSACELELPANKFTEQSTEFGS